MTNSLALQIEQAWDALTDQREARTFYLSARGRLSHGKGVHVVGTFTPSIGLVDFRDEVFWCYERLRRARHGG